MVITKSLTIDLVNPPAAVNVYAAQCDSNTRAVAVALTAEGVPWHPPEGVSVSVAFKKPDGKCGWYDTLPDKTEACAVAGNVVTAILAPEMLTAAGRVHAMIVFQDADLNQLATFGFCVKVEPNPSAGGVISNSYYKYSKMEEINYAFETMQSQIDNLCNGADSSAVLYTEQPLTPEQQAQARANIGAAGEEELQKIKTAQGKVYELIDTITLTEEAVLDLTQEPDGTPYAFERVLITGIAEVGTASGELKFGFNGTSSTYARGYIANSASAQTAFTTELYLERGLWCSTFIQGTNKSSSAISGDNYARVNDIKPATNQRNCITRIGTYKPLAAGSIVKIFAVRKGV